MKTSALIDHIQDFTGNTVPRDRILAWLDIAQNELSEANSKIFRDTPDEFLVTTAGVFEYTMPAGTRFVAKVYGEEEQNYPSHYCQLVRGRGRRYEGILDDGRKVYEILFDSNESQDPFEADVKITFQSDNDPGDTTDLYKLERYVWPTPLLSESIPLSIPSSHQTKALMYHVLSSMEQMEYGQEGGFSKQYDTHFKEWVRFSNRSVRVEQNRTKPRLA